MPEARLQRTRDAYRDLPSDEFTRKYVDHPAMRIHLRDIGLEGTIRRFVQEEREQRVGEATV
jgi:hypothetical protein